MVTYKSGLGSFLASRLLSVLIVISVCAFSAFIIGAGIKKLMIWAIEPNFCR